MSPVAIQILRRELGLSDARYRQLLNDVAGVTSSKYLAVSDATAVYRRMRAMSVAHTKAARYFWVLWTQLKPLLESRMRTGAWLCGFVRRAAGVALDDLTCLDALSPGDMHKAIEAIKQRIDQERAKMSDVPF